MKNKKERCKYMDIKYKYVQDEIIKKKKKKKKKKINILKKKIKKKKKKKKLNQHSLVLNQ